MTDPGDIYAWAAQTAQPRTLEEILTSPTCFGLTTASPLQRAICRIADGLPLGELAGVALLPNASEYPAEVRERATLDWAIGDVSSLPVGRLPAELYLLAGVRSGKSLLTSALGVRSARWCDVSMLGPGDIPRVSVVSLKLDLATVIYQHAHGRMSSSPVLKHWLIGDPTTDTILLQHETGRPVELKTVAGARAGGSLVARWSAGALFDEFPRMVGSADGKVVNFDVERDAVSARLLPGAQLIGLGSPWAPFGPAYNVVEDHWRKPSADVVVIRGVAPALNPQWWTPERVWRLKATNPVAYQTDILGEFADPEASMFTQELLEAVTRKRPRDLDPEPGHYYAAAMDPATRGNAWTLVVVTRDTSGRRRVALSRQWVGRPKPLSPDAVLAEIASLLRPYGLRWIATDQWSADAMKDLARRHGLSIDDRSITAALKVDHFDSLHAMMLEQEIELPPVDELLADLRRVMKKVTQSGVTIELPIVGGRHCDYAPALALAAAQPLRKPGVPENYDHDMDPIRNLLARRRRLARLQGTWLEDEGSWLDGGTTR